MNERKTRAWLLTFIAAILVLAFYPLAAGPWMYYQARYTRDWNFGPFSPANAAMSYTPETLRDAWKGYVNWWGIRGRITRVLEDRERNCNSPPVFDPNTRYHGATVER